MGSDFEDSISAELDVSHCVRCALEQAITFHTIYRYVIFVFPVRSVYTKPRYQHKPHIPPSM